MKDVFKISSVMMLALLVTTSCSKNDDDVKMQDDQNERAITQAEMQNKANPYDDQGVTYTGFMNAIMEEQGVGNWDVGQLAQFNGDRGDWDVGQLAISSNNGIEGWDVSQIISLAMEFNGSNGKDSGDKARRNLSMQMEAISNMGTFSPIDDCLWRPDRCRTFQLAIAALEPSNGGTAHDRTLKFISMIRDQEAGIPEDGEMNDTEKRTFLIMSSIARHAAGYWFNQTRETDVPTDKVSINMIHLSTLGSSTAIMATDSEEAGIGTAILSAYVATGRAN